MNLLKKCLRQIYFLAFCLVSNKPAKSNRNCFENGSIYRFKMNWWFRHRSDTFRSLLTTNEFLMSFWDKSMKNWFFFFFLILHDLFHRVSSSFLLGLKHFVFRLFSHHWVFSNIQGCINKSYDFFQKQPLPHRTSKSNKSATMKRNYKELKKNHSISAGCASLSLQKLISPIT